MQVKPEFQWRPQEEGNVGTAVRALRKTIGIGQRQPRSYRTGLPRAIRNQMILSCVLGARYGAAAFGVFPSRFQSCFGLVFSLYSLFLNFWNWNVYFMPLYIGRCINQF